MKVDIYKSATQLNKYLSVPAGTEITKYPFPKAVADANMLKLCPFKSQIEIFDGDNRIGLDSASIISEIEKNGFAIHSANISVTVHTVP